MSANRYLPAAHAVARQIPYVLSELGLKPFISRFVLTETQHGNAWLFVVLEVSSDDHPEDYGSAYALQYLSTGLQGLPVVISNVYGMRYAILLGSQNFLEKSDRFQEI